MKNTNKNIEKIVTTMEQMNTCETLATVECGKVIAHMIDTKDFDGYANIKECLKAWAEKYNNEYSKKGEILTKASKQYTDYKDAYNASVILKGENIAFDIFTKSALVALGRCFKSKKIDDNEVIAFLKECAEARTFAEIRDRFFPKKDSNEPSKLEKALALLSLVDARLIEHFEVIENCDELVELSELVNDFIVDNTNE